MHASFRANTGLGQSCLVPVRAAWPPLELTLASLRNDSSLIQITFCPYSEIRYRPLSGLTLASFRTDTGLIQCHYRTHLELILDFFKADTRLIRG